MANSHHESEIESKSFAGEDVVLGGGDVTLKESKRSKICTFRGLGLICALLAALCYSFNTMLVKLLEDLHPVQISLFRAYIQFIILLPLVQYKSTDVDILGPEGLRSFVWLRGFSGSTAMIFLYTAVNLLSVGNAVTITYISMILVPFMARFFLKESLTVLDVIFAILSFTGVVLIAQPTFLFPVAEGQQSHASEIGVLFALGSALCQATSAIFVRKLGKGTDPVLIVLYLSICGAFSTTIWLTVIQEWRLPCRYDLPYLFSIAVLGIVQQYLFTVALQNERASTVGVIRSTQIIMVYLFQIIFLGDFPTMLIVIGATLIFSTSIGIGIRKVINERKRRAIEKRISLED